ncbi:MAG TPA: hypothetical protein VJH92_03475 [Candidatus Nanoarchaeia archaeon]|nr:hypothetical protein [Candidatus Nanoarchaeia archaeon]
MAKKDKKTDEAVVRRTFEERVSKFLPCIERPNAEDFDESRDSYGLSTKLTEQVFRELGVYSPHHTVFGRSTNKPDLNRYEQYSE